MTKELSHADAFRVRAAEGWFELGNSDEAARELGEIAPANQKHPDVLAVRWLMLSKEEDWEACTELAKIMREVAPEKVQHWIWFAYSVRRAIPDSGLIRADVILRLAEKKFPEEPLIPYNLACYAAQMGKLKEAQKCLTRAFDLARKSDQMVKHFEKLAEEDPDLEPLRKRK